MRATRAGVDLGAIRRNVAMLAEHAAPAAMCTVVKADGYGHGAIAVGQAALEAGAEWLAVALVEEGVVLRRAGIDAPVLLLSEPRGADVVAALRADLRITVYRAAGVAAVAEAAAAADRVARVHLKVDTGMRRVGAEPEDAPALARAIDAATHLELEGVWTHCAVADEPGNPFTDVQLDRFEATLAQLADAGLRPPVVHAANSAGAIDHPRSRYDLVRVGIATYGIPPSPALADRLPLEAALSLRAEVSMVKRVRAGEGISYGLRHRFAEDTVVATVPIGYADGVPRRLPALGQTALVGGEHRPLCGVVTMDQLMIDCGPASTVREGDEVVLLGRQGGAVITPDDWAAKLETISYEIVCGIGPRVPRTYRHPGGAAAPGMTTVAGSRAAPGAAAAGSSPQPGPQPGPQSSPQAGPQPGPQSAPQSAPQDAADAP